MQQSLNGIESLGRRVPAADYFFIYTLEMIRHIPKDFSGLDHLFVLETDVEGHHPPRRDFYNQILTHPLFAKEMASSLRAVFIPTSYDTSTPALHRFYRHRMKRCGLVEHSESRDLWIANSLAPVFCVFDWHVAPIFLFIDMHCIDVLIDEIANFPGIKNVNNFRPSLRLLEEILRLKGRAIFLEYDAENNYVHCVQG